MLNIKRPLKEKNEKVTIRICLKCYEKQLKGIYETDWTQACLSYQDKRDIKLKELGI